MNLGLVIIYEKKQKSFITLIDLMCYQASEIVVEPLDDPTTNSTSNWQFALLELAGSHYAAICRENDSNSEGKAFFSYSVLNWII